MRGPLPKPADQRRRTNAPTIAHRDLPAGGRTEPAPDLPEWVALEASGQAWWDWAWKTPQATAWPAGMESLVARRATLEDDAAMLADVEPLDVLAALDAEDERRVRTLVSRLAALATNRLSLLREMRELDDRLGLSPKGMAVLRWSVAEPEEPEASGAGTVLTAEWGGLQVVDGA